MINHFVIPVKTRKSHSQSRPLPSGPVRYDIPLQNSSHTCISTTAPEGSTTSRRYFKVVNDCKMLYHSWVALWKLSREKPWWTKPKMWTDLVFYSKHTSILWNESFAMTTMHWHSARISICNSVMVFPSSITCVNRWRMCWTMNLGHSMYKGMPQW